MFPIRVVTRTITQTLGRFFEPVFYKTQGGREGGGAHATTPVRTRMVAVERCRRRDLSIEDASIVRWLLHSHLCREKKSDRKSVRPCCLCCLACFTACCVASLVVLGNNRSFQSSLSHGETNYQICSHCPMLNKQQLWKGCSLPALRRAQVFFFLVSSFTWSS